LTKTFYLLRLYTINAFSHNNPGNIPLFVGKNEKAINHYRRAIQINSGYANVRHNLEFAIKRAE